MCIGLIFRIIGAPSLRSVFPLYGRIEVGLARVDPRVLSYISTVFLGIRGKSRSIEQREPRKVSTRRLSSIHLKVETLISSIHFHFEIYDGTSNLI